MRKAPLRKVRAPVVILYHFTAMENVEAIKRDGLWAYVQEGDADCPNFVGNGPSIVWLCNTPTLQISSAELKAYRQINPDEPIVSKRWLDTDSAEPLARFTIRLSSLDRKLKQYGKWLRANYRRIDGLPNPDDDDLLLRNAMDEWWLYFGDIAPSKIRECIVEEAIPYRPLPAAPNAA